MRFPNPVAESEDQSLDEMLYAVHAEIRSEKDLEQQRGTPIPALFSQFYKFIQNPSTVSVETFKRMTDTDETLGAGIDFLQTCLAARVGAYQHKSQEVTEFINTSLDQLDGGFYNTLRETLEAVWAGFSVQEIVWQNNHTGFVPKKLVGLPPTSILFETERTGELTPDGILQYQRNYNPAQLGYGTSYLFGWSANALGQPDPYARLGDFPFPIRSANTYSYLSIRIPKIKCLVYANRAPGQYGNPYGRSLLRRCYKWWVMKDAFLKMLSVALDRKGTPLNVVFADPNATTLDPRQATPGINARGNASVGERADQAAFRAFSNIHNDSTIILPGKKGQIYDIQTISQQSNAQDFESAIQLCDRAFMRALLIPSLIFTNGDGTGSFALGQEHAKTWEKILDGMNAGVKQTWINQLISQIIQYNFPESAWKKDGFGEFTKRELTQDERDKEMNIFATAIDKGVADTTELEDLNAIREKIGLIPRKNIIEKPNDTENDDDLM
jgi:hypothetical protein